jgi:hypothetical protein
MTKTTATTSQDGTVGFRGFYGDYTVTLNAGQGRVHRFDIHLQRGEANAWSFRVAID